jgi:hypothetical protein
LISKKLKFKNFFIHVASQVTKIEKYPAIELLETQFFEKKIRPQTAGKIVKNIKNHKRQNFMRNKVLESLQ